MQKLKVSQCLTLCDTMDYTVHGILQARVLEWVAFPFSRGSSWLRRQGSLLHCRWILYQLSHQRPLKTSAIQITPGMKSESLRRDPGIYMFLKVPGFSGSYVWMWELDYKESWVPKNWCFWTVVLEKTFESPLDWKEKPGNPKENQSWIFIGRTDTDAETPVLWPPDAKNWLIGKDPDAGIGWRQEGKGTTEDEMVGWDHQLDGHEFE